jgi:hypothetical protein
MVNNAPSHSLCYEVRMPLVLLLLLLLLLLQGLLR